MAILERRIGALALALVLVTGCSSAPSAAPGSGAPPSIAPTPQLTSAPATPGELAGLADAVRAGISVDDILADLGKLQDIADANGGTRAAGTPGYDESADFVAAELEAAGFVVERETATVTAFTQTAPSVLAVTGGAAFEDLRDFKAMTLSPSGDVSAPIVALGFDPNAQPADRNGLGCNAADWTGVPSGSIVVVQPGPCRRHDAVVLAQDAGMVALITSYAAWPRDGVLRPTLVAADDIRIPVLGTTGAVGAALAAAAADGATVRVATSTSVAEVESTNVIAESAWGDPVHVVMLGGHLDSALDGPGINDNGSGTMTILEIARTMAELARSRPADAQPAWKLRVAFWTGEETGLFGSFAHANQLTAGDITATEAYLNFDMIGSRNGVRAVYQEDGPPQPAAETAISALLADALALEGLAWEPMAVGAASDHYPLQQAGIPIGGLYSGSNEIKSAGQAATFGGTADAPLDACYHLACDTVANIDRELLGELARAAAWVFGRMASGEVALPAS